MNKEIYVEECDATEVDSTTSVGYIIIDNLSIKECSIFFITLTKSSQRMGGLIFTSQVIFAPALLNVSATLQYLSTDKAQARFALSSSI